MVPMIYVAYQGIQPGNIASDPTNHTAGGTSGSSDSSLNLSTGGTVAIIVIVGLVVLLGGEHIFLKYVEFIR